MSIRGLWWVCLLSTPSCQVGVAEFDGQWLPEVKTREKSPADHEGWRSEAASASTDGGWEGVVNDAKEESGATEVATLGKAVTADGYVVLTEVAASPGREKEQCSQNVQD